MQPAAFLWPPPPRATLGAATSNAVFERNEIFRELFEDYETCTSALARQPASGTLRHEYSALQLRLETELLGYLHEDAEPAPHRK